ncbi:MAG: acyl carrier protein [Rhodospirillaceae bacterium]|nr:acyl carrier protein [Rhodospirillaceae bacterium]
MDVAESGTFDRVVEILRPFRKSEAPIERGSDLADDLRLDSLAVMDLMMELEERFDITIPLNAVPEIRTVGDLADFVAKQKAEG